MKRIENIPAAACLGLALAMAASAVLPAQSVGVPATRALLDKAHALETRGRMDMAAQTWQQVLLAEPGNAEALGGLARAAKLAGNNALADVYLKRLRAVNPNDPGIARAESAMAEPDQVALLQRAGTLAQQGNYTGAMNLYRQVFGAEPPAGEWALAYYQTEAATEGGRAHAIAGLRALVEKYPQDRRYGIALGRTLTYNAATRAEGRRYLRRYPDSPDAAEALRQSLLWDARNPAAVADLQAYAQSHNDPQVENALRSARVEAAAGRRGAGSGGATSPAQSAELTAAYAALNAKRFDDAETRFKAILAKSPQNARALAGIGYVRMNQRNFSGAISFLEQAKENGARDAGLDKNLEVSRFFYTLAEAGSALDENDLSTAEQKYQKALQMRPGNPEALQGMGGTLLKAGEPAAAVPYFQQALRVRPGMAAWRSLFLAQYQAGDAAAALDTEQRIPAGVRAELMRDPEYLRALASAYASAGRDADAQRVLQSALDLPLPPGARGMKADTELQYAGLLLQANRVDQASGLYRQVLAADPNNTLAWQGLVNAEHTLHNDPLALQTVESMPPGVYSEALHDPGFLSLVAAVYQSNGKLDLAEGLLEQAVAQRNTTGQVVPVPLQLQLAGLYLQRNDAGRAFPIFQRVLRDNPGRVDAWRGLLAALHGAGRDREALAEVQQIPPAVRKELEGNVDYLQTVGEVYNGLGQPRQAMLYLRRVEQHYAAQHTAVPADVDIEHAWLLYNATDDRGLYRQLLALGDRPDLSDDQRRTVQTIWANWAVRRANQASAAGNSKRALLILNAAVRAFPDNPAVIRALAGGYQRAGEPKEAVAIFKSQDMTAATASDYKAAVGAALAASDLKDAETWLRFGLHEYPKDGEMLSLAARFEQARGDSGRAAEYYRASLAALPPGDPGAELAAALRAPLPLNPRALPSAQQPQDLATLLGPDGASGGLDAAETRPYLPSDANAYGAAPVQLSGAGQGQAMVPRYMAHPLSEGFGKADGSSGAAGGSTLGQYQPMGAPGIDGEVDHAVPPGENYAPPAITYPSAPAGTVVGSPGMSEMSLPEGTAPDVAGGPDAYLPAQRADQQEQIRRANALAASAFGAGTVVGVVRSAAAHGGRPGVAKAGQTVAGEVYGPYVPYVPPTQQGAPAVSYSASTLR